MTTVYRANWVGDGVDGFSEEDCWIENQIEPLEQERAKRGVKSANEWNDAIIAVGTGYGCVVQGAHDRFVVTAAHCLPDLPPCNTGRFDRKSCYPALLGPPGGQKCAAAACGFADPISDIAVLGLPNGIESPEEFDQYAKLTDTATPLSIAEPPPIGLVWIPSPNGEWLSYVAISIWGEVLLISVDKSLVGMTGAPIVSDNGTAVGVLCPELWRGLHSALVGSIPRRLLRILGLAAPSLGLAAPSFPF
jgi:hypothetical protein